MERTIAAIDIATALGFGTAGQVVTSNGGTTPPSWAAGGGSGSVTAAQILALDFSTAGGTDPGGGKLWLNNGGGPAGKGVLQVGS